MEYRNKLLRELDFVTPDGEGLDLWPVVQDSDWSEGCRIGRNRAEKTIQFVRDNNDGALIGRIINAAASKSDSGSVLTGFTSGISEALLASAIVT
ncbi:hypothetical protein [Rhizobium phage RHph_X2_30]|nr:hypothetical protein [Rhizobium phage RHph_X2_30]